MPTPAHSTVGSALSYRSELPLAPGHLVRVPLGRRVVCGVVWDAAPDSAELPEYRLKPVAGPLEGVAPLSQAWRELVAFAAGYYQRSLGEVALAALPPQLRGLDAAQLARRLKTRDATAAQAPGITPELTEDQQQALAAIASEPGPSCCSAPPAAARPRSTCARSRR